LEKEDNFVLNKRSLIVLFSKLVALFVILAGCAPLGPAAPTAQAKHKVCLVTDVNGVDDRSFNATVWKGIEDGIKELGIEGKYLESQEQMDYEKNINAFIDDGCDLIITVGFLLGDATKTVAEKNPNVKFSIVDYSYGPVIPNVLAQVFSAEQAAFLAGYLAAGVTRTGKIGTFGGMQIPLVTASMDGYALGAQHYNKAHGTNIEVLGWNPATQTGLFTGNFESTDDGRTLGEALMDEGADILMAVAGPVGLGTAAAIQERGNAYIIGVDNDWYVANPEYKEIVLTSVLKNMDVTTLNVIKASKVGSFAGGVTLGTLENGGVGLAPFHELDGMVPVELKAELALLVQQINQGTLSSLP